MDNNDHIVNVKRNCFICDDDKDYKFRHKSPELVKRRSAEVKSSITHIIGQLAAFQVLL